MTLAIEEMTADNIPDMAELENKCFTDPWTVKGFESDYYNNDTSKFFIALADDKLIGYIGFYSVLDEAYITKVAVAYEFRRQKIASKLMEKVISECKKNKASFLSLEVRVSNQAAISLYEMFGFEKVGERRDFYSSPRENAAVMTLYF